MRSDLPANKTVLHAGCGVHTPDKLLESFRGPDWRGARNADFCDIAAEPGGNFTLWATASPTAAPAAVKDAPASRAASFYKGVP